MCSLRPICLGLLFAFWAEPLHARTWHIRADGTGDAPTIQAAIDSSITGDSLLIAPGFYDENLNTGGRGLSLSLIGEVSAEATITDGGGRWGHVLSLDSGGLVERLTIRHGSHETGAGILVVGPGSSPADERAEWSGEERSRIHVEGGREPVDER